jgi:HlyD family secretion protein
MRREAVGRLHASRSEFILVRMANNARVALLACLGVLAGCARPPDLADGAFQGVVEHDTVNVGFEVAGRVAEVAVVEGDHLRGDTLLGRLSDSLALLEREAQAAQLKAAAARLALLDAGARKEDVAAVGAELESLRSQAEVLERQRTRQRALLGVGAVPVSTLDALDSQASALAGQRRVLEERLHTLRGGARREERDALAAEVQALTASLAAMDERLLRYTLRHRGDTDVIAVHVNREEVVAPGGPAFTLADLDHPYSDVFVPQAELARVALNARAEVRVDAVKEALLGRVERIGDHTEYTPRYLFSESERGTLVVRVRVRIHDPAHALKAGVPALVRLGG